MTLLKIVTIVEGMISRELTKKFECGFKEAKGEKLPKGLLSTTLLKDTKSSTYRIETTWESKEALEEMRRTASKPKAIELFSNVGSNPVLTIYEQIDSIP